MTLLLEIRPEVRAEIARQAALQGLDIEAHAATLLEEAVQFPTAANMPVFDPQRARMAGDRIRELSKGLTLNGTTIRELLEEGRR